MALAEQLPDPAALALLHEQTGLDAILMDTAPRRDLRAWLALAVPTANAPCGSSPGTAMCCSSACAPGRDERESSLTVASGAA